jgi:hypothetical protein
MPSPPIDDEKATTGAQGEETSHVSGAPPALTRCEMRSYTDHASRRVSSEMRRTIKPWAIATLTSILVAGVGVAIAQERSAPNPAPTSISGGEDVNLSPQQMLDKVRAILPEMEGLRGSVNTQLADAKKKKDVVKALCLDDKSKQMKLATDTAKDRVVGLSSAVSQNDPDRSKHEFTVIQVLRERVQTLVAEAQQCIGEETGFIGNTEVTVTIDPAVPDADPSNFPDDPIVSEPPVLASPTM